MSDGLIGADDICAALEAQLRVGIPQVIAALGYTDLAPVGTFQQVPDADAIAAAALPAVAIVAPSIRTQPDKSGGGTYTGVWQAEIAIFDRGRDHQDTQSKIQRWAKVLRAAILLKPSLGGVAESTRWVGEDYSLLSQKETARTFAAADVLFDITVSGAVDVPALAELISPAPTAQSAYPTIRITLD